MPIAYWRKCDFQVHSPRDPNWQGIRPLGLGEVDTITNIVATETDVEFSRSEWAISFIEACCIRNLGAVAITDHHEMVMLPYVFEALKNKKVADPNCDLWVFPGMELTAKNGVQCLILFDADLPQNWWELVMGKLNIEYAAIDKRCAKGPPVTQLPCSYAEIGTLLEEINGIAGKYIILPNISEGNGNTALKNGHHAEFKSMMYVGGYLDCGQTFDTLGSKNKQRLSGEDKIWSTRRVYPLPTSDSRASDFAKLGQNNAWIKLSQPSAEALRQAFLSHQSRISIASPRVPSLFIDSVEIRGSSIFEKCDSKLSPELTTIIGGRGSGKSTFLEYIAFGIGRSSHDVQREHYSGTARMQQLVKDTIISKTATVKIRVSQDGAVFEIVRGPSTAYQPLVTYPNKTTETVTDKELRSLFPALVYSQGELADLGKNQGLRPQLTDLLQFVSPEYKREDDHLARKIDLAKNSVKKNVNALSVNWAKQSELRKLRNARTSLLQRIDALEKTLPALSADDQKLSIGYDEASAFEAKRLQASKHVEQLASQLSNLEIDLQRTRDTISLLPDSAAKFSDSYGQYLQIFRAGVQTLISQLATKKIELEKISGDWHVELLARKSSRDEVLKKLGDHQSVTGQIISHKEESAKLANQIGDLESELQQSSSVDSQLKVSIDQLKSAAQNRADRTIQWASELETLSNGSIRASVELNGDVQELREALDVVASKTGSNEATRVKGLENALELDNAWTVLERLRSDASALLHWSLVGAAMQEHQPVATQLMMIVGDSEKVQDGLLSKIDATRVEVLACAIPKPTINLSYVDGQNEISFDKASEGQRAAALLFMLLGQEGGPLLVDQPEGDLDNKIIAALMDKLHTAKQKRQLLFVSHNANIVVNGSAELVNQVDLDPKGQRQIAVSGAIDDEKVRNVITSTMEGGEKAFKDRQLKYGY
jgi:chromosome segregation protein